jgi:hypothetical protein
MEQIMRDKLSVLQQDTITDGLHGLRLLVIATNHHGMPDDMSAVLTTLHTPRSVLELLLDVSSKLATAQ